MRLLPHTAVLFAFLAIEAAAQQAPAWPDPLIFTDGRPVTTTTQWQQRRREILALFEEQVYGRIPANAYRSKFRVFSVDPRALAGTSVRKQIHVDLTGKAGGSAMDLLLYLPATHTGRVPVFLGLNFGGNQTVAFDPGVPLPQIWVRNSQAQKDSRSKELVSHIRQQAPESSRGSAAQQWQLEKILAHGYGLATIYYGDIEPDFDGGLPYSVRHSFASTGAPDEWGAIGAWAWGLSRALDYLETDPDVDAHRVALIGHSRLGKAAMWAGAQDQRFALVISNNSGQGGAGLAHRQKGETIEHLNTTFPHWFCGNYKKYTHNPAALPVDGHLLAALIASRPLYIASAQDDTYSDPEGEFLSAVGASPVYELLGKRGLRTTALPPVNQPVMNDIAYHMRTGKHDVTAYDWDRYLEFADRQFSGPDGWPVYGHDVGGARYSPLRDINTANVARLQRAWVYHTGDAAPLAPDAPRGQHSVAFEATPLVIDDVMYVSTPAGRVIALDADTGRELWTFSPWTRRKRPAHDRPSRGVSYWPGNAGTPPRIFAGTADGRLLALNARTGIPVPGFGDEGEIDLRKGAADAFPDAVYDVTSPPAIYRDLVITGAEVPESPGLGPSGDVRAFDVRTGKLTWRFHTIPQPGEAGHETWRGNGWQRRTGANVWSIMTLDAARGLLFLPIGSPSYDFYGGDRKGQNLYGDSLVALHAATGEIAWHYQFVHHDVWDYDPPAPPALITAQGKPAVVEVTKMGLVFILDRLTGKPLFEVKEVPVPQSRVPGEETWPTQPVPLKPAPLSRSSMSAADLTTVTPESHSYCADLYATLSNRGRYTPFDLTPTLVFPGTLGGATWSGVSFDPERKLIFVNANEAGAIGQLTKQPDGSPNAFTRTSPLGGYARFWDTNHWPCQQPPWGTLSAINVDTGETAWKVPLGTVDELEKRGIHNTGTTNIGGSIATAGGLVFIGAASDERFRAFDASTGKELWTAKIDASAYATPITYRTKKGRQFVVVAAGGGGFFSDKAADTLIGFSLP